MGNVYRMFSLFFLPHKPSSKTNPITTIKNERNVTDKSKKKNNLKAPAQWLVVMCRKSSGEIEFLNGAWGAAWVRPAQWGVGASSSPVIRASARRCSFLHRGMNTVMSRMPLSQNQFTASWMPWHENTFLSPWLRRHRSRMKGKKQQQLLLLCFHAT